MLCCHIQPASDEDKHFLLLREGHLWSVYTMCSKKRGAAALCIKRTHVCISEDKKLL